MGHESNEKVYNVHKPFILYIATFIYNIAFLLSI
jgi:hypothetical protein